MSITVIIARDDIGAPSTSEVYEVVEVRLDGGDLCFSPTPALIALYPSGNWLSVHVDNYVEVVTVKPAEDDDTSDSSDDFSFGGGDDSSDDDPFGLGGGDFVVHGRRRPVRTQQPRRRRR